MTLIIDNTSAKPYAIFSWKQNLIPAKEVLSKVNFFIFKKMSDTVINSIEVSLVMRYGRKNVIKTLNGFYVRGDGTIKELEAELLVFDKKYLDEIDEKDLKQIQNSREYRQLKGKLKGFMKNAYNRVMAGKSLNMFLLSLGIIADFKIIE